MSSDPAVKIPAPRCFPSLSSRGNREVGMGASAETGDGTIGAEGKGPELETWNVWAEVERGVSAKGVEPI